MTETKTESPRPELNTAFELLLKFARERGVIKEEKEGGVKDGSQP